VISKYPIQPKNEVCTTNGLVTSLKTIVKLPYLGSGERVELINRLLPKGEFALDSIATTWVTATGDVFEIAVTCNRNIGRYMTDEKMQHAVEAEAMRLAEKVLYYEGLADDLRVVADVYGIPFPLTREEQAALKSFTSVMTNRIQQDLMAAMGPEEMTPMFGSYSGPPIETAFIRGGVTAVMDERERPWWAYIPFVRLLYRD